MEKLVIAMLAAGAATALFRKLRKTAARGGCACDGNCSGACTHKTRTLALLAAGLLAAGSANAAELTEAVSVSGVIEVEASYLDTEETSASDIALATVEIAVGAQLNSWLGAEAVFLFEEDDTDPPELDSAVITVGDPELCPFYIEAGKMYLPFGNYESLFVSDPVTLEIGETAATALLAGVEREGFNFSVSAFNSDVPGDDEDDHIDNFVAALSWAPQLEDAAFALGASYIRNIAESGGLGDAVSDSATGLLADPVGGWSAWLSAEYAGFILNAEYLAAADDFEAGNLSFDGAGNDWENKARPRAVNLELGRELSESLLIAVKYENTKDCFDWMPEERFGAVASTCVWEEDDRCLVLALEYMHANYDTPSNPEEDSLVFQAAIAF